MSVVRNEISLLNGGNGTKGSALTHVIGAYVALTKPKIMVMLIVTAYSAMMVAGHHVPSILLTVKTLLGLAGSAGAGAALNMWYDRDIDGVMERTSARPLPSGVVSARAAFLFGIALAALSTVFLAVTVNGLTALLSLAGCAYYVVVYTMWLKRRTPQNIVIGGGAGAFPPLVGWAAVTGHLSWLAWLMFAVIFLWTPPHFWALALYKNEDYVRANIPMLPVVKGFRHTKIQMLVYTLLLFASTLVPCFFHGVTLVYTTLSLILGIGFTTLAIRCLMEPDHSMVWARRMFFGSLTYVPVWFLAIVIGSRGMF